MLFSRAKALMHAFRNHKFRWRHSGCAGLKEVFESHYRSNEWGSEESVSGPGSTLEYTENLRRELPQLVRDLGVRVILDAPCGDFNWMGHVEWRDPVSYLGGDIVDDLIRENHSRHGREGRRFSQLDIVRDPLPMADLWLCRDCLFHLSFQDIFQTFQNFLGSGIPYLLTSTHPGCKKNLDIMSGYFRLLNLCGPPFNLIQPDRSIDDWIEGFPERKVSLWSRDAVEESLRRNPQFLLAQQTRLAS